MPKRLSSCTLMVLFSLQTVVPAGYDRTQTSRFSTAASASKLLNRQRSTALSDGSIIPGRYPFFRLQTPSDASATPTGNLVEGQASTLLSNGAVLLTGGAGQTGPTTAALIQDPKTGIVQSLPHGLNIPRSAHTATVLPNGTVLIFGGVDSNGKILGSAEIFDPQAKRFSILPSIGLTARAYHSATILTDGSMLVAGGVTGGGETSATTELWDPRSGAVVMSNSLHVPRKQHSANLLPDGEVLISAGTNQFNVTLDYGEIYDPTLQSFRIQSGPVQQEIDGTPFVEASIPEDGATGTPQDSVLSIRFSQHIEPTTLNDHTVVLKHDSSIVPIKIVSAEQGMLAFITPLQPLDPGSTYVLSLDGGQNRNGAKTSNTFVTFTTAGGGPGMSGSTGDEDWTPASGNWQTGRPDSPWTLEPPLKGANGVTALAGQALKLNGQPIANVTLTIDQHASRTDNTGRFLLSDLTPGHHVMLIDGRTTKVPGKTYGVFEVGVDINPGVTNVLAYTIWMTALDMAHSVTIPSPTLTETVITTPLLPGLELRIPPGTVIRDSNGKTVSQLSITPVPLDRPPFPLPNSVDVPIYFTIQPGASYLEVSGSSYGGARLIYPNTLGYLPGTKIRFWNYDADVKGWYIYGHGTALPDKRSIIPDPGVEVHEFTGAMVGNVGNVPGHPPTAGGKKGADPVDLSTGLFTLTKTDLYLPDVIPLNLTRGYLPGDTISRNFGIGSNDSFDIFIAGNTSPYTYMDLVLADGTTIYYPRISAGTGSTDAVYQHTATPTAYYGSTIIWNGNGWTLKFKDGRKYIFPDSFNTNTPNRAAITSVVDRNGNTVTFTRDSSTGNLLQIISPNGRWMSFTRDSNSRITQVQDNTGRAVNYTYDTGGRLSTVTDANGGVTTYTYDTSNRMLTIKDARGIVYLTNQYDTSGRVTQQTQADNSTYQFSYTSSGGVITQTDMTDPRGKVRRLTFNSAGYASTDIFALGAPEQQTISYALQAGTNLTTSVTDALNRQTSYTYDALGNVTSITRLAGTSNAVTSSFSYDSNYNLLTSITDPLSHTVSLAYDQAGNLVSVSDPLQHQTTFSYNGAGQPITAADAAGHTTQFAYDSGDLVGVTDPLGDSYSRFVDSGGRVLSSTDPLGHATRYQYNALNQVTSITDAVGGLTSLGYDANGNLLSVTDANNHVTSYTYNSMDRVATRTDPLNNAESYNYDANGNLSTFTDRRGKITSYGYDALNRRTFAGFGTQAGPAYESTINNSYDVGNRPTSVVDSVTGTMTPTFDGLNRLTSLVTPQGTVSYTYDAVGRRTSMTAGNQSAVNYTYDNGTRLTQITQGSSTVSFAYDTANRRTSLTLPNGIVMSYSYDNDSELSGITYMLGSNTLGNLSYTYDVAGRRTSMGGSYAKTALPLAITTTGYNADNQLTQWGTANLYYDANGNMTSDGTNSFVWNARNQLASMDLGAFSFQYDAYGRRSGKTASGITTNYLYDSTNVAQELSAGTPTANLLSGGVDEIFTRTDSNGTADFLTNALGSTLKLTDPSGNSIAQYAYEPFGNTTVTSGSSANPYQYTGRQNDGSGLYFYRARYYNPSLQRFISEDPIGFGGGQPNLYAYVGNNPLSVIDPTGMDGVPCMTSLGAGFCSSTTASTAPPMSGRKDVQSPQDMQNTQAIPQSFSLDGIAQAEKRCQDNGQLKFTVPGTGVRGTVAASLTAGIVNVSTTGDFSFVFPPSFGFGIDTTLGAPNDPLGTWAVGLGKNASVGGSFTNQGQSQGLNVSVGPSVGADATVSLNLGNICAISH